MNGKLRRELAALRRDVSDLAGKLDGHASAADLAEVHKAVKAIREDLAGQAKATQTSLNSVTSTVRTAFEKAAELAGTSPAPAPEPASAPAEKKANGKAAPVPTKAATAAAKENL